MTKIFVGSLPYTTTNEELADLFKSFGQVATATVVMDKFTGRSRGFGFVEMPNDEEAQKAISELNGYKLGDRALAVSVARPREERPQGGGFSRDNRGGGYNSGGFNRGGDRGGFNRDRRGR